MIESEQSSSPSQQSTAVELRQAAPVKLPADVDIAEARSPPCEPDWDMGRPDRIVANAIGEFLLSFAVLWLAMALSLAGCVALRMLGRWSRHAHDVNWLAVTVPLKWGPLGLILANAGLGYPGFLFTLAEGVVGWKMLTTSGPELWPRTRLLAVLVLLNFIFLGESI